jgi:quercetin dioxygenase-like cupin family protein
VKAAVLVSVLVLAVRALQTYPTPFPREGATKVLENDRVAVWMIQWTKGRPTPVHEHRLDVVAVAVDPTETRATAPDGSSTPVRSWRPGDVFFQPAGVIHREESLGDGGRLVAIELKPGRGPGTRVPSDLPRAFPRDDAKLVQENAQLAVWDVRWTLGRAVPAHTHDRDVVSVTIEPGVLKFTAPDGQERVAPQDVGAVVYVPRGNSHREESVDRSPRAIIIELK